jgi:hypothetical protein
MKMNELEKEKILGLTKKKWIFNGSLRERKKKKKKKKNEKKKKKKKKKKTIEFISLPSLYVPIDQQIKMIIKCFCFSFDTKLTSTLNSQKTHSHV